MADKRLCACNKSVTVKNDGTPRQHVCNAPGGPAWKDELVTGDLVTDLGGAGIWPRTSEHAAEVNGQPVAPMDVDETDPFVSPTATETENWNGTGRPRPSASNVKLPPAEPQAEQPRLLDTLAASFRMAPEVEAAAIGAQQRAAAGLMGLAGQVVSAASESAAIGAQQMADSFSLPTPQGSGPVRVSGDQLTGGMAGVDSDPFSAPTPTAAPLGSATDQPQTWRNSYGQYVIKDPRTGDYKRNRSGKPQGFTRATTFAKTLIDQFGIHQWEMRTLLAGLALRPDLAAKAQGLDVAGDKDALQDIIAAAKEAAGGNQAATDGTDFHTVTEWIDAGRMRPEEAPEKFRSEALAYSAEMTAAGLTTRPEWIERVLFTDLVGEDVAGTADRILRERNGQYVIGDVKSGKGVDLGQREIAMQLKHYAMSVNQFGLYKKTSEPPRPFTNDSEQTGYWEPWTESPVSEEYGIVMHVPLVRPEGTPAYCDIYRIDLRGVEPYGVAKAHHGASWVRGWRKAKGFLSPYRAPAEPAPVDDVMAAWEKSFRAVTSPEQANQLWQAAKDAGMDQVTLDAYVDLARMALSRT